MKIRPLLLTLLISSFFCTAQAQNKKYDNSICWEVRKTESSQPSYIFGSIHLLDTTKIQFPVEKVKGLIDKTGMLCLEISGDDLKLMAEKLGNKMYLDGDKREHYVSNSLDSARYKKLISILDSSSSILKPYRDMLDYIQPSYLDLMMTVEKQLAHSSKYTVGNFQPEMFFSEYAKTKNLDVKGLETADEQVDLIVDPNLTFDQSMEKLKKSIDNFDKQDSNKIDMLLNYQNQNLQLLPKEEYVDSTMVSRNKNMARGIDLIIQDHPVFVIIGAAHLPYKNGVINQLAMKGYTVRPYFLNMKRRKSE